MGLLEINWGNTLIIVGLGFGIVFVILTFLVFVLNIWQKLFTNNEPKMPKPKQTQKPTAKINDVAVIAAIAAAMAQTDNNADMAAIAAALHLYFEDEHDVESNVLTIKQHQTEWNRKSFLMKQTLIKK
ncbi:MAG: OadG family protein [Prevotellaceae bacterium]|jgi:sodium pump decarboxylase gamma subunit|nr:OadG family protein [Prevotellaceae bacterium]